MFVMVPKIAPPKIRSKWMLGINVEIKKSEKMIPILRKAKQKIPFNDRESSST